MNGNPHTDSTHSVERLIAWVLRAGVWGTSVLLLLGIIVARISPPVESRPISFKQMFNALDGLSLLYAGTLLMILTPFVRVLLAAVGFSREGDKRFVGISMFVFCLLIVGAIAAFIRTH